ASIGACSTFVGELSRHAEDFLIILGVLNEGHHHIRRRISLFWRSRKAGAKSRKRTQKSYLWHSGILVGLCVVHQITGMAETLPAGQRTRRKSMREMPSWGRSNRSAFGASFDVR